MTNGAFRPVWKALRALVYVFLALPSVIVVTASVSETEYLAFPPQGFTLRWYETVFHSAAFMDSLLLSVKLAVLATILAIIIGTPTAYTLDRHRFRGRTLLLAGILSPLIVPGVVLSVALLQLAVVLGVGTSFWTLLVGHVVVVTPYVVRMMISAFSTYDRTLEEAAMSLRAGPIRTALRITLPVLAPSLISSAVFAFVMSFGNVIVSIFLGGVNTTTLPVQIFSYVQFSYDPSLAAVSSIIIVVTIALLAVVEYFVGYDRVI